jgi:hypothetical protein
MQARISPDGINNQIDHILVDEIHATSILNVRSLQGASCGSDHFLARAQFRCHICKKKGFIPKPSQINVSSLKD